MNNEANQTDVPLILFSGMGADDSVFLRQKVAFPNLIVPDWLPPFKTDDLSSYCARLANFIGPDGPVIVGGASFGGIVALEMTRHLDTLGCILIGSVRGPHQLPNRIRMLRSVSGAVDIAPISMLQQSAAVSVVAAENAGADHLAGVTRQFANADPKVLRWSAKQILRWDSNYDVKTCHIHGDRDHVFPISCVEPDEIVVGGGHVISMTHGRQVNEFLCKTISRFSAA
jgi:thioesterase domain-containing protein